MRISTLQMYRQATDSLNKSLVDLYRLNEQISSGKRINKPSDDVTGTSRAMAYKVSIAAGEQYLSNIKEATSALTYADSTLSSVNTALTRLKELSVEAASGSKSGSSREALAQEAGQLRDQLLSLANTRVGNSYIFSGFRTDTAAFDSTYAYQGDSGSINVGIAGGVTLSQNVTGADAFGYVLGAAKVVEIDDGVYAHYAPGAGTTVAVEIRDSETPGGGALLDSFSYGNAMELADVLTTAMTDDDARRISACLSEIDAVAEHVNNVRADLGARINRLEDQGDRIEDQNLMTKESLSSVEDADFIDAASELSKAGTVLQAVQAATAKILSQSLLDFLD